MSRRRPQTLAHLIMRLRSSDRPDLQRIILSALEEFGALTVRDLADGLGYKTPHGVGLAMACLLEEDLVEVVAIRGRGNARVYALKKP